MSGLTRRTQILLDEESYERLRGEAERRRSSVGAVIREAIDDRYPSGLPDRAAAIDYLLSLPPLGPVGDWQEMKREIRDDMYRKSLEIVSDTEDKEE